jgi:hypothetical protein
MSFHPLATSIRDETGPDGIQYRRHYSARGVVLIEEEIFVPDATLTARRSASEAGVTVEQQRRQAEEATRLAALGKLRALGLTDEEIRALRLSS